MSRRLLRSILGLLAALGLATPAAAAPQASRRIVNIAEARWSSEQGERQAHSNRVDIPLIERGAAPGTVSVNQVTPSGATAISLAPAGCTIAAAATPVSFPPVHIGPQQAFRPSQTIVLVVRAPALNRDPASIERLTLVVTGSSSDRESVLFVETGPDSGEFVGHLRASETAGSGDCRLALTPAGSDIAIATPDGTAVGSVFAQLLLDPYGIVFDSRTGAAVDGVRVSIVDATTGAPALVYGDDGISTYPSTIVSGQPVLDSGGTSYRSVAGGYRFPLMPPGRYRLIIEPPGPYLSPSTAAPEAIGVLARPGGGRFTIDLASYGEPFALEHPDPLRIDLPLDPPIGGVSVVKTAYTAVASVGDVVSFAVTVTNRDTGAAVGPITVRDILPPGLRLREGSIRWNGAPVAIMRTADGFQLALPPLAPNASGELRYLTEVRPDARPGAATNRFMVDPIRGAPPTPVAAATVRIRRDDISNRVTIAGRVSAGDCATDPSTAVGVPNVRLLMPSGQFAVTDSDGRYHFEGVRRGPTVVAIDRAALPPGASAGHCGNVRSAMSGWSQLIDGRARLLYRADFHLVLPQASEPATATPPAPSGAADDVTAGGGRIDWFALTGEEAAFLFPAVDHNPRAPAVRVAIRHLAGQTVRLALNGQPADSFSFEGVQTAPDQRRAVSVWRALRLQEGLNRLSADVLAADGRVAAQLSRSVHYSGAAARVEFVPGRSRLIADGVTRPVIAMRVLDRAGQPVRHGTVGAIHVAPPHRAAADVDAEQARQLSGLDRAAASWRVDGDDGVALVELAPTTTSGMARISLRLSERNAASEQVIEAWLDNHVSQWTLAGFGGIAVGSERLDDLSADGEVDGRLTVLARGPLGGGWQATARYDSDDAAADERFGGMHGLRDHYTLYGDRSEAGFEAPSLKGLFLRLERRRFYAMYGDFDTGIDTPELARFQRSLTGFRSEFAGTRLRLMAFAAESAFAHRRDEQQANGLSGPYALTRRDILPNSERVTIEVRDRLRFDRVVERRELMRYIDYDIDYASSLIRFREPQLSRDEAFNPRFIVVDYELDGLGDSYWNAGGRAEWRPSEALTLGATVTHDAGLAGSTDLGGIDARWRPDAATEVRAEYALSRTDGDRQRDGGTLTTPPGTAHAWLIEAERHQAEFDLLAYIRRRGAGFGNGQSPLAGNGSLRFGFDARARLSEHLSLLASAWDERFELTDAQRRAARILGEWRSDDSTLRAGLTFADDRVADGNARRSLLAELGGSHRLFDGRLELDGSTSFALGGDATSVDFPERHTLTARLALVDGVRLIGTYEIADGGSVSAETARVGFDVQPWRGARLTASGGQQSFGELGSRTYAAYGLAQSFPVSDELSIDASVDGQRTLSGLDRAAVLDPAHPVASGGFVGNGTLLSEDFLAVSAGASWRSGPWNATGRVEYRDADTGTRFGATAGVLRQLGEGRALGGLFTHQDARGANGTAVRSSALDLSWAHRPAGPAFSLLNKLTVRDDDVRVGGGGLPGPIGGMPLAIAQDVRSRRVVNALALSWDPVATRRGGGVAERGHYGLFVGLRHASDRIGGDDVAGWSASVGADARFDLNARIGVGLGGSVRTGTDVRALDWSVGPQITLVPAENLQLQLGYNFAGYRDRDFEAARATRSGWFASIRMKFDAATLAGLGLDRR